MEDATYWYTTVGCDRCGNEDTVSTEMEAEDWIDDHECGEE